MACRRRTVSKGYETKEAAAENARERDVEGDGCGFVTGHGVHGCRRHGEFAMGCDHDSPGEVSVDRRTDETRGKTDEEHGDDVEPLFELMHASF